MQDIVFQLQRLVNAMSRYHTDCFEILQNTDVFPIEVDLSRGTFTYDTSGQLTEDGEEEEGVGEVTQGVEALGLDAGGSGDGFGLPRAKDDDDLININ